MQVTSQLITRECYLSVDDLERLLAALWTLYWRCNCCFLTYLVVIVATMGGTLPVTCLYAGLHAVEYLYLTSQVIRKRRSGKVAHGDGGDKTLARRIRVSCTAFEHVEFSGDQRSLQAETRIMYHVLLL